MRGALIIVLAAVVGAGTACLVSIDESRLNAKDDPLGDDDNADARAPKPKDAGKGPDSDSVEPTKMSDGGLTCPEPTSLCAARCFDTATSNAHCGTCGTVCGDGTACTNKVCRAASCKAVQTSSPAATTGPTAIGFQGTELDVFCDQTTRSGGWTMLHRLSAGPGLTGDPLTYYTTIPLNDTLTAELTPKKTATHYTSRLLGHWNAAFPVAEVMIRIYDALGNPLKEAVFNGTGSTFLKFMVPNALTASSWTDLNGGVDYSDFGVDGTAGLQRRFLLHRKYTLCQDDTGWLIVHGTPADVPCKVEYESPFDRIRIVYSAGTTSRKWGTEGFAEASSFAVFVR